MSLPVVDMPIVVSSNNDDVVMKSKKAKGIKKAPKVVQTGSRKSDRATKKRTFFQEVVNTESVDFRERLAVADAPVDEQEKEKKKEKKKEKPTDPVATIPVMSTDEDQKDTMTIVSKKQKTEKNQDNRAAPLPLTDIHPGDTLSQTLYLRVTQVRPEQHEFRYRVLRGPKEKDDWTVTTPYPFSATSSRLVTRTVECSKTELAKKLMTVKDEVFTVKFKVVLTPESLGVKLQELKTDTGIGPGNALESKKLARELMDTPEKSIVGRLVTANTELGYSLVDDLSASSDDKMCETRFKNVNHRDIVEIIHRGVSYVLKKK